jgi:hypothetical protein
MIKLKVSKEKLLQWYADNDISLYQDQIKYYVNNDWESFINCDSANTTEKCMFKNYFEYSEPEPDYKDLIGEDCVFSDFPFDDIINFPVYPGVLLYFNGSRFKTNYQNSYEYCMLKKDYVKLIKEQIK